LAPDAEYRRSTEHVFTDGGRYAPRLLERQETDGLGDVREFFWNGRTQTLWLVVTREVLVGSGGTIRNYYEEIVK
jgi:hypothetical protein